MTKYANPENDDGVPVVADHESDEFALRRKRSNLALDKYPQLIPIPVSDISGPVEIDWAIAFPDLAEPVGAFMRSHKVRESSGKYTNGPFTTDAPFPIVGLRTEQLLQSAAQPDALLVPRTSAFVVPILKDGIAVDSFMLLHRRGGWSEGGYSSNHIANLCNVLRAKHGVGAAAAKDYYLVSIPEQGAFFIGRGFKDQAKLLSLGNDGKGEFAPAREVLERLIRQSPRAQTPGATHDR
jgi:hypothetical protein